MDASLTPPCVLRGTHTRARGPGHQAASSSVRPARASHTQGHQKFHPVGTFKSKIPAAFKSSKKINMAPPQLSSLPGAPKLQVQPTAPPPETSSKAAGALLSRRTVPDARALSTPPRRAGEAEDRQGAAPSRPLPQPFGRPHDTHTLTLPCQVATTEPGRSRRYGQGARRPAPAGSRGSAPAPPKENTEARQREAGGWVVQTRRPTLSAPGGWPPLPASGRLQWGGAGQRCPAPGLHLRAWRGPLLPPWGPRHTRGPRCSPTDPWVPASDYLAGPPSPAPAHPEWHCPPTSRLLDGPGGLGAQRSRLTKHPAYSWPGPSPEPSPPHPSPSRHSRDPRDRRGSPRPQVRPDLSPQACPS